MKKTGYLLLPTMFLFAVSLFGQKLDKEGSLWLQRYKEDAAMNVNGVWQSPQWGPVTLIQTEGSRELTGDGDGWEIKGVVSGKTLALLFHDDGSVEYSAELTAEGDDKLTGSYSRGLMTVGKKTKPLLLTKGDNP